MDIVPSSILCFSKLFTSWLLLKGSQNMLSKGHIVMRNVSTNAPFAKSILLHVFTSVTIYEAMYITTKYCFNKAIPYILA